MINTVPDAIDYCTSWPDATRDATWGVSIDADGKAATSAAGLYLRPGCNVVGATFKGFSATSARGLCCRDGVGTYTVHHCHFEGNWIGLCASSSVEYPGTGSVLDFYANSFDGNLSKDEYVLLYANTVNVLRRCLHHGEPAASADTFQHALLSTSNRVTCRYATGTKSIGHFYRGNGRPYRNALAGTGEQNGVADMDNWHAVDELRQAYIVGIDRGCRQRRDGEHGRGARYRSCCQFDYANHDLHLFVGCDAC